MEPESATIRVLEKIQATLAGLRDDTNARFERLEHEIHGLRAEQAKTNESLAKLHDDMTLTNETLGVMNSRLSFSERSATAATEGRARLDERVDRLDEQVRQLAARMDAIAPDDDS